MRQSSGLACSPRRSKKLLLPVQSEARTLDQMTVGQSSVGAARKTAGRFTPARDSCVPVRTPYRTRFRTYQGPANPERTSDEIASSRQRLRSYAQAK